MTTEELYMWTWYILGGMSCGLTSFLVAGYKSMHSRIKRRLEYAAISALGALAISYIAYKYYPDAFRPTDSPALGIIIGLCGIGRVLDFLAQKCGIEKKPEGNKDV